MSRVTAHARFAIQSWDEKPYSEGEDQPKLTRASVASDCSAPPRCRLSMM